MYNKIRALRKIKRELKNIVECTIGKDAFNLIKGGGKQNSIDLKELTDETNLRFSENLFQIYGE